jgi:hypothetical protein
VGISVGEVEFGVVEDDGCEDDDDAEGEILDGVFEGVAGVVVESGDVERSEDDASVLRR